MTYQKIVTPQIQAAKDAGMWICDSADHNSNDYCSNPECFKSKNPPAVWNVLSEQALKTFKEYLPL